VGIQYNTISKKLGHSVDREGLNFGTVGFTYIIFPSIYNTMEFSDITVTIYKYNKNYTKIILNYFIFIKKCLNKDGVVIEIEVSYQFKAK
jgi:hypothetical protein